MTIENAIGQGSVGAAVYRRFGWSTPSLSRTPLPWTVRRRASLRRRFS